MKPSHLNIENGGPPLHPDKITALEQEFGLSLPTPYREFLLEHNGGVPEPSGFPTKDGKVESYVSRFFPVVSKKGPTLGDEIKEFTVGGLIPRNLIPIAEDPTENRICLSASGRDAGRVYYWSLDEEDDEHEPSYDYMRLIARSFDEFLKLLQDL